MDVYEIYDIVKTRKGLSAFLRLQAVRDEQELEYIANMHVAETVRCVAPQSERVTARPSGSR